MADDISTKLLETIKQAGIKGFVMVIQEDGENLKFAYAADDIKEISIYYCLAKYIFELEKNKPSGWAKLFASGASIIMNAVGMIEDLTSKDK